MEKFLDGICNHIEYKITEKFGIDKSKISFDKNVVGKGFQIDILIKINDEKTVQTIKSFLEEEYSDSDYNVSKNQKSAHGQSWFTLSKE